MGQSVLHEAEPEAFWSRQSYKAHSEAPQQGQGLESVCFLEGKLSLRAEGCQHPPPFSRELQSQGTILSGGATCLAPL